MSVQIKYNNTVIESLTSSKKGIFSKYTKLKNNIEVVTDSSLEAYIYYNGKMLQKLSPLQKATILCRGKTITSDLVIITKTASVVVKPKLATPVIYLEIDGVSTTAILGKAILGHMILGTSTPSTPSKPKLDTPVIYLEEVTPEIPDEPTTPKLDTPVIRLYKDDIEIPDVPVLKLDAPVIYLEDYTPEIPDEPEGPGLPKLDTPYIYLESTPVEIPDEPEIVIPKLDTPDIYLDEVIIDIPDEPKPEPEEPEIPEEPELIKLDTPDIYLDEVIIDIPDEPITLEAPVLELDDFTLSWNEVENATAYEVYVNNKLVTTTEYTTISINEIISSPISAEFIIQVKATDGTVTSAFSNEIEYMLILKLDQPYIYLEED